jgi:hypothetical protein
MVLFAMPTALALLQWTGVLVAGDPYLLGQVKNNPCLAIVVEGA